jgi:hypothetical protein
MSHVLQQLPLIYNKFHVLSAAPRNMDCNMKQPPDRDIAETIAIALCPLRRSKTQAQAQAGAETAIRMLRTRKLPSHFQTRLPSGREQRTCTALLNHFGLVTGSKFRLEAAIGT